jgi:hypothetical protein
MGLPGFRCGSMPLPDVLIFSCRPELEAAFTALEELFGVAAAVDMNVEVERECAEFRCGCGRRSDRRGGRSSDSEVSAAMQRQAQSEFDGQWREPVGGGMVV